MKNSILTKTFIFSFILIFAACEVSSDEPAAVVDESGNEVNSVEATTIDANDNTSFERKISSTSSETWEASLFTIMGVKQSCRLDDVMAFMEDGTYQYSSGLKLCMAEDSQRSRTGTWEVDFDNRMIIFDKGTLREYRADVIGLSDTELRLKGSYKGMEIRGLYSKR